MDSGLGLSAISGIYDFLQSGKYSALIWASAFVLVVLISLAALAWRREIGRFFERVSGSDQPKQLLYSALAVAVIIEAYSAILSGGSSPQLNRGLTRSTGAS